MSDIAKLISKHSQYNNADKELFDKYLKLREELDTIEEKNKVEKEEKILKDLEVLFTDMGGTEEELQVEEEEEEDFLFVEEEELQTKQEETVELPKEEEVVVIPEEEEQPAEEIILSESDIAEEKTMADKVSKLITKQAPKVKEKVSPIQAKINKLEHRINELFNNAFGGGLDPNKISAHLIPTTANTFDLGSSDRPWRDVHLSGATLVIGGTELAAGELIVLDNITAGTVSASKAVIADSSKDITGFRNVNAVSYSINGTAIASTAAELNILDGVTSTAAELNILDGVTSTAAELNIMDGVTSTAAELNILDGVTSTTAELNIVDGVTSTTAELNILDGVTSTTAELNIVDGVTATTAELNILDVSTASGASTSTFLRGDGSWQAITGQGHTIQNAGSNLASRTGLNFDGTYLIGTDDSGSNQTDVTLHSTLQGLASVTSTAAELNIMDGVTSTTAELNILDGVTSTASELNINDGATLTTDEINLLDISTAANASTSTFLRGDGSWQSPTGGGASLAFKIFSVSGQSNVVADDTADTLTLIASGDTTITTNAGNDSITIDTTITTVDGGNF